MKNVGWFADLDNDRDDLMDGWQPCLEMGTGVGASFDIWFTSEEECLAWIRESVLPAAGKMWGE